MRARRPGTGYIPPVKQVLTVVGALTNSETGDGANHCPTVKRVIAPLWAQALRPTVKRELRREQEVSTNSETGKGEIHSAQTGNTHGERGSTLRRRETPTGGERVLCAACLPNLPKERVLCAACLPTSLGTPRYTPYLPGYTPGYTTVIHLPTRVHTTVTHLGYTLGSEAPGSLF